MTSTTYNLYDRIHAAGNRAERGTVIAIDGDVVTVRWDTTGYETSRHRTEVSMIPRQPEVKTTSDGNVGIADLGVWITTGRDTEDGTPMVLISTPDAPASDSYTDAGGSVVPRMVISLNDCDVFADYGKGPATPDWYKGDSADVAGLVDALADAIAQTVDGAGMVDALGIDAIASILSQETSTTADAFHAMVDRRIADAQAEVAR